ncbi:hypothetical protein SSX86_006891 [Deinandra increscens subsp. villosa]|uniref:Uncharacterized protein n=1 Tax=Deinandra increscens subsp. villosa TaxID=3103831 RepID=A0AAP0H629_9ASTR
MKNLTYKSHILTPNTQNKSKRNKMGSDEESDPYSVPKLPLFSTAPHLPEPSGTSTPPLQTAASVPFRWEEQPGKPRPVSDLIILSPNHTTRPDRFPDLILPPRLFTPESTGTPSPSPTTVLDGPGDNPTKPLFNFSSSKRFSTERCRREGSFDSEFSGGWSPNDVVGSGGGERRLNSGGGKPKGSFVISRSVSASARVAGFFEEMKGGKRRSSKVSKVIRSHFLSKIYEGFKQVVPWRKKPKMEAFTL